MTTTIALALTGNSVAVPCVQWVAQRILAHDEAVRAA